MMDFEVYTYFLRDQFCNICPLQSWTSMQILHTEIVCNLHTESWSAVCTYPDHVDSDFHVSGFGELGRMALSPTATNEENLDTKSVCNLQIVCLNAVRTHPDHADKNLSRDRIWHTKPGGLITNSSYVEK